MKFTTIAASAATLFASVATAAPASPQAVVINSCKNTVYVQSYPYGGGQPGPLTTVAPGKSFTENQRGSGSTVKIGTDKTLSKPLFFGYSFSKNPDYSYYEFSTQYGNPFAGSKNTLSPGAGCQQFNCAANDAKCYSTPSMKKVYGCPSPVTLTAHLCA